MNRIEFATHLFSLLRRDEKPVPVTRYAILFACAAGGEAGSTVREVAARIGDDSSTIGGSFTKLPAGGYLRCVDSAARPQRWKPTEKGMAVLAKFLTEPRKRTGLAGGTKNAVLSP